MPASTSLSQSISYSVCEPVTQWTLAGWVSSAIFSTQRMRWVLVVGGAAAGLVVIGVKYFSFGVHFKS